MARFLLDGRNLQSFHDALERFQEKGTAFHLAYDLVDETGRRLEAALIIEPGPMFTQVELAAFALDYIVLTNSINHYVCEHS
ncbi:hypothetical protein AZE42_07349 [Rhizopogon vesiculosus]|uniref:Uncharacterized protein n=1 Tax=Rhizopogon vesiculosus TaxID=180088 RepID=A0A1J8PPA0_9AGAM|nr:hypothetical protein AZE42_07349 [Rhizopogon vesiculosus]